jgi:hypothetical protein
VELVSGRLGVHLVDRGAKEASLHLATLLEARLGIRRRLARQRQNNPIGTCAYNSGAGFCLNADYSTAFKGGAGKHCDCSGTDVANCPGRSQVCKPNGGTDWCITCGESGLATNGLPCKGGGACNAGLSPPRCM